MTTYTEHAEQFIIDDPAPKTTTTILTPAQRQAERLRGLASVYQTADRILSGERLTVEVVDHDNIDVAAWTTGAEIYVNAAQVDAVDFETVERLHGVNFHELSHVLYTPRQGTTLVAWVLDNNYAREFNVLEDQRIESLLTARYPSTAPWLVAAIARWVLKGGCEPTGYLWVRGRKYLDGRLRGALRQSFNRQDLLPEVDRIIDGYRALVFPRDYETARELITDFAALLKEVQVTPDGHGDGTTCPHGHDSRPVPVLSKGRPQGVTDQRRANERLTEGDDEVTPPSAPQPEQSEPEDVERDPEVSEPSSHGDESSESSADETASGQGSSDSEQDTPTPSSPSKTAGNGPSPSVVADIAQKVLDEILASDEVIKDIQRTQRQVNGQGGSDIIAKTQTTARTPLPEYASLFGSLRKSLERLLQKSDPGWNARESHGRINGLRWSQERDLDTAFDLWDEGVHDAVDMEVVILLDESGSMGNVMEAANNAVWVAKRALDRIDASTTVISFDNTSKVLYHRNEKATHQVRYTYRGGGTNPVDGLAQAARIFGRTRRTQKILIVLTDGEWGGGRDDDGVSADEYIRRLNRGGVTTALGYIVDEDFQRPRVNPHGCQISGTVNGAGLTRLVTSIVTASIQKRLAGR